VQYIRRSASRCGCDASAMPDPIAIWGAVTGTAGLGLATWRERRSWRRSLRVERGWQYVYTKNGGTEQLKDVWVSAMAWNTGHRPLSIEHVGFEFIVPRSREQLAEVGVKVDPGDRPTWINIRFEIALNGETIEVVPDGPSVKVWTRIGPILDAGVDPTTTLARSFVVTVPETYWWSEEGPLLPVPPQGRDPEVTEAELAHLSGEENTEPMVPGKVIGLPRLLLEGEVERTSDLFDVEQNV
jgi:hypothetical protein